MSFCTYTFCLRAACSILGSDPALNKDIAVDLASASSNGNMTSSTSGVKVSEKESKLGYLVPYALVLADVRVESTD